LLDFVAAMIVSTSSKREKKSYLLAPSLHVEYTEQYVMSQGRHAAKSVLNKSIEMSLEYE